MTNIKADSKLFEEVARHLLGQGLSVRFQACGSSMFPTIRSGEIVEIAPIASMNIRKGDIVLANCSYGFRLHRVTVANDVEDIYITRGDSCSDDDLPLKGEQILGVGEGKEVWFGRKPRLARFRGVGGWALRSAARVQFIPSTLWKRVLHSKSFQKMTRHLMPALL